MTITKENFKKDMESLIAEDKQDLSVSNNLILSSITLLSVVLVVYGQLTLSNIIVKILLITSIICSLRAVNILQDLYNTQSKYNSFYLKLEKEIMEEKGDWSQIENLSNRIWNKKQIIASYSRSYWRISKINLYIIGILMIFNTIIKGVK